MKNLLQIILRLFFFTFLTLVTQIGGIIYLISLALNKNIIANFRGKKTLFFLVLYLFSTFAVVPNIAPFFDREKVKHSKKIKPTTFMTILLNRNYVVPELNKLLAETEKQLAFLDKKIELRYLDANFPFIDGFPLPPHLSHNDGKKIDISFVYEKENGVFCNEKKSISGYGVFEEPRKNEANQPKKCKNTGYFQYDFAKYLTFGTINKSLFFSEKGTKILINSILQNKNLGKLFIEPHLKNRLQLNDNRVRFHGCRAIRHDDHIHIQLK